VARNVAAPTTGTVAGGKDERNKDMIDQNQFDKLVTEHYAEDREETDAPPPMTPHGAIQCAIFDLVHERRRWQGKEDESGVLPWIEERIANLEQAQRDLAELRKIKAALAVLKDVI